MATHAPTHSDPSGHAHHSDPRPLSYWWKRAALWSVGSFAFAFGLVWFMRSVFGMEPLWEPQVYVTASAALTTIGFLIGIGCFDYWWQWMTGRRVDPEDHSMHGAHGWRDYFKVNTDHKVIGVQYMAIVFSFFVLAGLFAELVRAELVHLGPDPRRRRDLQRPLQRPRDGDDLPLRHPRLRGPGELRAADHDRREGHGLPAPERLVGVDAGPRRPDDDHQPRLRRLLGRLDRLRAARHAGRHRRDPLRGRRAGGGRRARSPRRSTSS